MNSKATYMPGLRWKRMLLVLFIAISVAQLILTQWAWRWLESGAPILTLAILLGEVNGKRVFPFAHAWSLFTTINLAYAVSSTSWLLYWVFTVLCYPAIYLTCLSQFKLVGLLTRRAMRTFITQLHFIDDKIALFNIPALEIDTTVDGLLVFRGVTFSLSTLTFTVHGVEVGIKLSDDMELAIQTDSVTVALFRNVEVGDCFANLKGGDYEMSFGHIERNSNDANGDALLASDNPVLRAATGGRPPLVKMTSEFTGGSPPEDSSPSTAVQGMKGYLLNNHSASAKYNQVLKFINDTSAIQQARRAIEEHEVKIGDATKTGNLIDDHALRSAICSRLHSKPSVPNPPKRSVKVTTIRKLSSPRVKRFLHRLPMLLRLLLNPLAYFHPVKIASITATASGRWIEAVLVRKIFKEYQESDSELQAFKNRISSWVADANFVVQLGPMAGLAHVPFVSSYDINCQMAFENVLAYRTLPKEATLKRVIKLGGADATFIVPTFLLPHHEHLVPPKPKRAVQSVEKQKSKEESSKPTKDQGHSPGEKDETNVKMSVRARLPAIFDQELLDFIAASVKAAKLAEIEHASNGLHEDSHRVSELAGTLNHKMKEGFKKAFMAPDQWLARMVGKVMTKLEKANGDVGYSGAIPVRLAKYRETGWLEIEGDKLLT